MAEAANGALLKEKILLSGTIESLTGLHIGGNDVGLGIGGADKLVVRDARSSRPYIPGSSLKGKMRSLLEKVDCLSKKCLKLDSEKLKLEPCSCRACDVCWLFGVSAAEAKQEESGKVSAADAKQTESGKHAGAGRLLVRDAFLTDESAAEMESWSGLDAPYTEVKTEVAIDRLTSRANPRQFERVPAGAVFRFEMVLNVYEGDDAEEHLEVVRRGLRLMADDAIGGQGSRGYGQVRITLDRMARITIADYQSGRAAEARARNVLGAPEIYGGRLAGEENAA